MCAFHDDFRPVLVLPCFRFVSVSVSVSSALALTLCCALPLVLFSPSLPTSLPNSYIAKCQHGRVHQRWVTNARDSTISPLMAPKLCVSVLPIPQVGVMASANVELGLCTDLLKEHRWLWKGVGGAGFGQVRSSFLLFPYFFFLSCSSVSLFFDFNQLMLSTSTELCMTAKSPTFGANVALWSCELSSEGTQATYWHSVSWAAPRGKDAHAHAHAAAAAAPSAAAADAAAADAAAAGVPPQQPDQPENQAAAVAATTGGAARRRLGAARRPRASRSL